MAQLVEQLTLNQWVPGSSPGGCTTSGRVEVLRKLLANDFPESRSHAGFTP